MTLDPQVVKVLEAVLRGISDVLDVAIILTGADSSAITEWAFPGGRRRSDKSPKSLSVRNVKYGNTGAGILQCGEGQRRFVVDVSKVLGSPCFVQSAELPDPYPWTDAELTVQCLPGCTPTMSERAEFLLGVFVSAICDVVSRERCAPNAPPIDDLDVENIRRIGVSLRKARIATAPAEGETGPFSLEGVPGLETFFPPPDWGPTARIAGPGLRDLTEIFRRVTAGTSGSFNLMSLSGDFVVRSPAFEPICVGAIRPLFGSRCLESDVRCLVEAALAGNARIETPNALRRHCHAEFTEIFCPIFTDRLIIGLVFGGQLLEQGRNVDSILKEIVQCGGDDLKGSRVPSCVDKGTLERTKNVVSGLASLIGLLFDQCCLAKNTAALRQTLVGLGTEDVDQILRDACIAVKRFLGATECSTFRLANDELILAATTSTEVVVRQTAGGTGVTVKARDVIGKSFYKIGEGLTGSVLTTRQPRYVADAMNAPGWAGRCCEGVLPSQCLAVPILHEGKCYGVLRAVRPTAFSAIPESGRDLIVGYARELGIVLHGRESAAAVENEFRERRDAVQSLLATAAHEFQAPLHNVLQLSTALRYAAEEEMKTRHEQIKEEVYRAKKIVSNYLLFGIEGREELRYDFRVNNVAGICANCMSRLQHAALAREMQIVWDARSLRLLQVTCDRERMEQVFTNLIDNAIKYGFENTDIVVRTRDKTNTVTISITDMGLGIPKEFQEEIFAGYQRSIQDKSRFKPGTGLGLNIARQIIRAHGGDIFVESEAVWDDPARLAKLEGYTSTFTVSLPKLGSAKELEKMSLRTALTGGRK